MQDETADKVNAVPALLKAFVILGGIALLIGVILLAVMIMLRASNDQASTEVVAPAAPVDVPLPADMRVTEVVVDGKRLILFGEVPDGQQYIAVVDADSGARRSLIRLAPAE
ncbi:MAG: hypothetical protein AAGA21_10885 [Pseudomonadota bacterium]